MPLSLVSFHEVNWWVSSQIKINRWSCAVGYFEYCHCGDFVIAFGLMTKILRRQVGMDRTVCRMGGDGSESMRD